MRARAGIVSLALGIVGGAMALAHAQDAERAGAADAIRLRAEELAQAASRRFDEVMGEKETRVAQAQGRQPAGKEPTADDALAPFVRWLERSNREYQTLMRQALPGHHGSGRRYRRASADAEARRNAGGRERAPEGRQHDRGPGVAHQGAVPVHHAAARRGRRPAAQERAGRGSAVSGVGQAAREEGREVVGGRQALRQAGSEGGGGAASGRDASGGGAARGRGEEDRGGDQGRPGAQGSGRQGGGGSAQGGGDEEGGARQARARGQEGRGGQGRRGRQARGGGAARRGSPQGR